MEKSLIGRLAFGRKTIRLALASAFVPINYGFAPARGDSAEQWLPFELKDEHWSSAFAAVAKSFPMPSYNWILASGLYQLLLTDKPNVDTVELSQALLWSIKDMVTLPVPQIHLDYFESPIPSNKINVVVVDKAKLVSMVQAIHEQNLQLIGISIEELAMTNLFGDDKSSSSGGQPYSRARVVIDCG